AAVATPLVLAFYSIAIPNLLSARLAPGSVIFDVAGVEETIVEFEEDAGAEAYIRDFDVQTAQAAAEPQPGGFLLPPQGIVFDETLAAAAQPQAQPLHVGDINADQHMDLVYVDHAGRPVSRDPSASQWSTAHGLRPVPVDLPPELAKVQHEGAALWQTLRDGKVLLDLIRENPYMAGDPWLHTYNTGRFQVDAYVQQLLNSTRRTPAFAYQHKTDGQTRSSFTETLLWHPFLLTDDKGQATVEFDVNDSVTTWKVYADAFTRGRVGQAEAEFQVELPFHMDVKVPVEVTQGDELQLPVSIVSSNKGDREAAVKILTAGPLALGTGIEANKDQSIKLLDGRGRLLVPVTCTDTTSPGVIAISGAVRAAQDRVTRGIRIVPRGFPKDITKGGTIDGKAAFKVKLPKDLVKGSAKATLRLYPSTLSTIQGGLQGILREPHGCFEQTSSSNYPNTMVLTYLEASGDNIPSMANRARQLLPRGYNRLVGYECSSRGYEWWGKNPGHDTLTAYGLMQFHDMQKVYSGVDTGMISRTRDWLLSKRDGKGGFKRDHGGYDHFAHAPNELANAYILWSLTTTGTPATELKVELDALAQRLEQSRDPYELALIACAMHEAGKTDRDREGQARIARAKLGRLQQADGSLAGATTITQSGGRDLVVETTSLAVLAWVTDSDGRYLGQIHKAIDYLCTGRTGSGSFGATQATILALKALTAHAGTTQQVKDGEILVFSGDKKVARQAFTHRQAGPTMIDLTAEVMGALGGEREISMEITGGGKLPWTFDLSYHADQPADDDDCQVAIETFLSKRHVEEGGTVALTLRVDNLQKDKPLPMTMAIVGLPAGLHVSKDVLDDLKKAEQFAFYELRGREVILYWRGMTKGRRRQVVLDLTARIPGTTTGPASRAYLYYTPDQKRWAQPLKITVRPGR
ncbi:MAG: alpha-2-macroglobulin family protein, partial [Planctomycetota bacterium]